jgi:RNA recognition motif-containing protein
MRKEIPNGHWIFIKNLPVSTTDESLSEHFRARGLDIGPEYITIRTHGESIPSRATATAIVSVSNDVVLVMFDWVLNNEPIGDRVPRIEPFRSNTEYAASRR